MIIIKFIVIELCQVKGLIKNSIFQSSVLIHQRVKKYLNIKLYSS